MYSVDIVIPTYKRADLIERCLNSLSSVKIPESINNIWVVENGPICDVEEVVKKFEEVLPLNYLYLEPGNLSLARNTGIEHSKADIIIFFDNDLRFEQNTIQAYVDAFEKYGDQYFYGGSLDPDYETLPPDWLVRHLPPSAKGFDLGSEEKVISKSSFLGGNHAFFRKHLIANNCYDVHGAEGFNSGAVGEETRLQRKLLKKNVKGLYVPKAKVLHYVPSDNCSIPWLLKRAERYGQTLAFEEKPFIQKNTLLEIPYFHWVRMLKTIIKLSLYKFSNYSQSKKFAMKYEFHFQKGVFRGYRSEGATHR